MKNSNKQTDEVIQNPLTSNITYPINIEGLRQCPFCNQFPRLKVSQPVYSPNTKRLSREFGIQCDCGVSFNDANGKYFVSVTIEPNGKVNTINTLDSLIEKWNKRDFSSK